MEEQRPGGMAALQIRGFERVRASLIVVSGEVAGEEHEVDQPRWLLGRGPDVDASIEDPEVSPRHAAIEYARGAFTLTDLSEDGGTQVNGSPVRHCELSDGDRIEIGGYVFQMLIDCAYTAP